MERRMGQVFLRRRFAQQNARPVYLCACSCVGEDEAWKNKDDDGGGEKTSASRGGGVNLSAVKTFAIEHGRR